MTAINSIGPCTLTFRVPTRTAKRTMVGPYAVVEYENGESEYKLECANLTIKEQRRCRRNGTAYSLEFEGYTREVFSYDPDRF